MINMYGENMCMGDIYNNNNNDIVYMNNNII